MSVANWPELPGLAHNERLGPGTVWLHAFALAEAASLLAGIRAVEAQAPLRRMQTPGGQALSVAMTNSGAWGWVTDRQGYRYVQHDPLTGHAWPALPDAFRQLAGRAAEMAGFPGFCPDACLINCYEAGSRMGLHQDRDERDLSSPIVSVSLGLPAVFLYGGLQRGDKTGRILLEHGDVLVWGGPDRLRFHGVKPLAAGLHSLTGACRFNLTFRKAT